MQELVKELIEKAGLTEEQAQKATEVTMEFVKSKVPAGFEDKIDDIMNGKFDPMSMLSSFMGASNPLDKLKNMFGGGK